VVTPLIDKLRLLKLVFVFASFAFTIAANSQTYQIGSGQTDDSPKQGKQSPSTNANLGWGSNIQNARLARAAQLALQRGDHAQALDYAQRAAQAAPNDPQLWFLLGYAARLSGKYQLSEDAYNHGLRLSPSSSEGLSGLAQDYMLTNRTSDAERLLKQLVASNPGRADDAMLLGDIYMKSRDYNNATQWLEKAERMHPSARSELMLALSYQQLKQMDQASHYLDLARRRSPHDPEVQRSLAGYYRETGKYPEAIAALKSIRNPKPDVQAELAYTYQLGGKLDDSAQLYAQVATAQPKDMSLQLSAAQAEVAVGSTARADTFLQHAAEIDPNYYRLHAVRGEIAQLQDRSQDAVDEYKKALASLPANPVEGPLYGVELHMNLVGLYQGLDDQPDVHHELDTARSEINAVDANGAGRGQFLRLRALIKLDQGDLDGSLADVKDALALNENDPNDLQLNGDVLMKLGRVDDAIAVYKSILSIDASNRMALTSLGYAARAKGQNHEAEEYFERLVKADPKSYVGYLALGDLYTSGHDYAKAQSAYADGHSLAPKNAPIVAGGMNAAIEAHNLKLAGVWLARATGPIADEPHVLREKERYLSFSGKYQESEEAGERAIKALPRDRDVVVYLGYDYLRLEKYNDLLNLTQKYMNVLPKEPDIPLLEGYVYKHNNQPQQAMQDFTEALARDPTVVTAYVNRGYMLNDLHQAQQAASDFESALQREPNDGEAHLGLAYADLDLQKPMAAIKQTEFAERAMGESMDLHLIRATAYGRVEMLTKAEGEYRSALKIQPNDAALHFGLGNTLFAEREYREAVRELSASDKLAPNDANTCALLARSYANLKERDETLRYVGLAEKDTRINLPAAESDPKSLSAAEQSNILVETGEALSTLGEESAAMDRFKIALDLPQSDRVAVRLAIAQLMAQQNHTEDAEREVALAMMEAEAGDTAPPNGNQYIAASDVFSSVHDYRLSQSYLDRARAAGAPDTKVRIALANSYLALGDTSRAQAELSAMSSAGETSEDYQFLLAEANVYRQEHQNTQALTSFAQASNAAGQDQTAEEGMLQAGADEGLRVTPNVSLLSNFSMDPIYEDSTVYVLDSKLDTLVPVSPTNTSLLPPPRSSLQTQDTTAFHLHFGQFPTSSGFFQVRNARGQISVPANNAIVNRDTTDYTVNFGVNPTIHLGDNVITFNSGVQATVRRDSLSPVDMNQNLFRVFTYVTTSSFFNALSMSGYIIRESGPFTESHLHSRMITGAIDFRVGAPWGRTAFVTGWGAIDQLFTPVNNEDYYTSMYAGIERKFSPRLNVRALIEDLRAWRIEEPNWGNAQNLRPAATVDYIPARNWEIQASGAFSSTRSFHAYDAIQSGFSVTYGLPVHRRFREESGPVELKYPIRFSAGLQNETFYNFSGPRSEQLRPYVQISIF